MLGSQLIRRQRNGLAQISRQIDGCSGEATEADSGSGLQPLPTASGDLSVFSSPISGTFQG
jgi:hypothetical protein